MTVKLGSGDGNVQGCVVLGQDTVLTGLAKTTLAQTPSRQRDMEPKTWTELLLVEDEVKQRSFQKGVDLL